jgi:lysozyme family protein
MNSNFEASLAALESARDEGGYVNNPHDTGGATNHGITQATYDKYRQSHGLLKQDVRDITQEEAAAIYNSGYWLPAYCNELPVGVDFCVFDFAVNSGVYRSVFCLQQVVGALQDGQVGPKTLAAVAAMTPADIIDGVCNARMRFLEGRWNFSIFGDGWKNRVDFVRETAKQMAGAP